MNTNNLNSDQLPDENYINRLFPKCPPKHFGDKLNSSKVKDSQHKKHSKSKVLQHSRRELEARRQTRTNLSNSSNSHNNNGNNSNIKTTSNNLSSGSSDESSSRNFRRSGLRYNSNFHNSPSTSSLGSGSRKSSKYTASQSLLQQLKRSQSNYCNRNSDLSVYSERQESRNNVGSTDITKNTNHVTVDRAGSGIVRSASSFVFADETSTISSSSSYQPSYETPSQNVNRSLNAEETFEPTTRLNMASVSMQANTTADSRGSDRIDIIKRESTNNSNTNNNIVLSNQIQFDIIEQHPAESQAEKRDYDLITSDGNSRDEDKYINLFVYDNATHQVQKSIIPSIETKVEQDFVTLREPRYRPIAKPRELLSRKFITEGSASQPDSVDEENSGQNDELNQLKTIPDQLLQDAGRSKETEATNKVLSVNHQASGQLLTTDQDDTSERVIRNDASTEELCSAEDNLEVAVDEDQSQDMGATASKPSELDSSTFSNNRTFHPHKVHSSISTLQTVDESAEIALEQDAKESNVLTTDRANDNMPANTSQVNKKGFVPPGYPRRITSIISDPSSDTRTKDTEKVANQSRFNDSPTTESKININEFKSTEIQDGDDSSLANNPATERSTSLPVAFRRNELMPIIDESQNEILQDSSTRTSSESDKAISADLGKMSISVDDDVTLRNFASRSVPFEATSQKTPAPRSNLVNPNTEEPRISHPLRPMERKIDPMNGPMPLVSHHKLPNETSHFSLVKTTISNNSSDVDVSSVPHRSSSLQFNTLSDGESGNDEGHHLNNQQVMSSRIYNPAKKTEPFVSNAANRSNSTSKIMDDDLPPTTKTALIFPRLDEGLSSEAESCDEDVEDDDERAIDADVDADDDDDDEDDVDDDDEDLDGSTNSIDQTSQSLQLGQASIDNFLRQQQIKTQGRQIDSLSNQHSGSSMIGISVDQSDMHQVKAPGSAYGGYMNQDSMDSSDLKPMSNYPSQNGHSNYWTNMTSHHQQSTMSSQPSTSQQFNTRSQNNNSLVKNNSSFNREEAKTANRLSSDTDNETDRLLGSQRNDQLKLANSDVNSNSAELQSVSNAIKQNANSREVLIEGVLFNVKYLGSTHTDCEGRSEKEDRIHQAEMAVHEVKFRNGESQMATEVQLFISTEKIMVLDDKHRKIMMDHSLKTISYVADIGDAIVLIVRKKSSSDPNGEPGRPMAKISCHVFESSESHTITKSVSQAFNVAYAEFVKGGGAGDGSGYLPKDLDYQEVLNSQEMSTDELEMFAKKENHREVIVPKEKGEILGLSIVESGWGSYIPTVVISNLKHDGPADRCKKLNIGDQILSVNGTSLVQLSLAECQEILSKTKNHRVVRLSVVPCPITVEVKIKRPDTKYQLGFSVQNGVICSLLRGGIAERGGVRVGHRIMSINGTTVVNVPHEKIVTLLANSVGEIRMKTCLTSLYRQILGEENPVHF